MSDHFPALYTSLLDADKLHQVLHDIDMLASDIQIKARSSSSPPSDLDAARRELVSGAVRAIQVRYRHDGVAWCDTLTRTPMGVRLHRIQCDHDQPGGTP